MNARSQITMDPETQRRAHAKAEALGISFAEYVRRLVQQDLGEQRPAADVSVVFDLGASAEVTDIARDKDKLIGDAVWEEYLEETGRKPKARRRRK
jgi:GH24 family phage-related lysozyme (muramidase)